MTMAVVYQPVMVMVMFAHTFSQLGLYPKIAPEL